MSRGWMADAMFDGWLSGKGFLQCDVVSLLVWSIYQPRHSNNVCVAFDYANDDIVVKSFYSFYYLGYEELI